MRAGLVSCSRSKATTQMNWAPSASTGCPVSSFIQACKRPPTGTGDVKRILFELQFTPIRYALNLMARGEKKLRNERQGQKPVSDDSPERP